MKRKYHKIWFQLTGSHGTGQPEHILHADKRFLIGGMHSLGDSRIKTMKKDRVAGKPYEFLDLKHTSKEVVAPKQGSGYPKYAWWYHNKLSGTEAFAAARKILEYDPNVYFIYFSCSPMQNALTLARLLKKNMNDRLTIIHYKRYFWHNEVKIDAGIERNWIDCGVAPDKMMEHFMSKAVENELIEMADIALLADSLNTKGEAGLDSKEKIRELVQFRDNYLQQHPKIRLYSVRDKVYELYDEVDV